MFCRGLAGSGYGHFGGYGGGEGMFLMMGFGFLIFLALIFLAFKLMKNHPHSNLSSSNNSAFNNSGFNNSGFNISSLNILNERFAKGEIDEDEYTKKKIILNQKN